MKIEQAITIDLMDLAPPEGSHFKKFQKQLNQKQLSAEKLSVTVIEQFDIDLHSPTGQTVPEHSVKHMPHIDGTTPDGKVRLECVFISKDTQQSDTDPKVHAE